MKSNKRFIILFMLILLLAAAVRVSGLKQRGIYFPDEIRYYKYAAQGCSILRGEGLKSALKFAGDTFTAKPGHTALGILWMNLFGISSYSAVTMNVFFGMLTVLLIYMITRTFYSTSAGLIAALGLALSSLHAYYSRSFMSHIDQAFFIMLAFYLYCLPLTGKRNALTLRFASGLLLGIAFTIHPTAMLYIAIFFVYELILFVVDKSRSLITKIGAPMALFAGFVIAPLTFLILNTNYFSRFMWVMNAAKEEVLQRSSRPVPFTLSRIMPVYEGGLFAVLCIFAFVYFCYRLIRHKRTADLFIFLFAFGLFLYWEFFAVYSKFSRQALPLVPFLYICIGVFITDFVFRNKRSTNAVKILIVLAVIVSGGYSTAGMLISTRNYYGELEGFMKGQAAAGIITPSEYFSGSKDALMPNLKTDVTWLNEKEEIARAMDSSRFDFLVIYPSDWLGRPEFRLAAQPVFTIKEPQSAYFAEFYEGLCFKNRLDLLKYRTNPMSYSIAVYRVDDSLKEELRKR